MRLFSVNNNASAFHGSARNTSSIPRHHAGLSLSRPIGPISPVSLASAKVLHFRPLTFRFLPFPLKFAEYFRFLFSIASHIYSPTSCLPISRGSALAFSFVSYLRKRFKSA